MKFLQILILSGWFLGLFAANEPIILRGNVLPGAKCPPQSRIYESARLSESFWKAGTLAMWLRPDGWSNQDPAWHFFLMAGIQNKNTPNICFYRFPDGKTRLLWSLNANEKKAGEIITQIPFASGEWMHLAFTWKGADLTLYVNGAPAGRRRLNFEMGDQLPMDWKIGDVPYWNPKSKFTTTLGRVEIHPRALSEDEISALARQKMEDGMITVADRKFTPGSVNRIWGRSETNGDMVLEIKYVNELGQTTTVNRNIELRDGQFSAELAIPDDAVETRLTLKDKSSVSPVWKLEKIKYADWLPPREPDFWQASWIWYGNVMAPEAHRYFVTSFEVDPDTLELAAFQGAGDDRAVVYLNGRKIAEMSSWAVPTVKENLKDLLVKGKNTLAVDAYNVGGSAGFLGELSLLGKDGSMTCIGTDDGWSASDELVDGWNRPGFDAAGWGKADVIMRPPQLPYGETAYRNFRKIPVLRQSGGNAELKAEAGKSVEFKMAYDAVPGLSEGDVYLKLIRKNRELYSLKLNREVADGKLYLSGRISIPAAALSEEYELKLESRGIRFENGGHAGKIKIESGQGNAPLRVEVKKENGLPVLYANGTPVPPMLYRNAINFRNETRNNRFISGFDRKGIRLAEMGITFGQLWKPDGSIDTDELELHILSAFYYAPDTSLVLFFNTDAPAWYVQKYPAERYGCATGPIDRVSYASERWRGDSAAFLEKLVRYIKSRPYYNRIAGFGLDGGEDGQFMQWTGRNLNYMGDYSPSMVQYYHRMLEKKYGDIANLNQRWQRRYHSFDEIVIPTVERRKGSPDKLFLDPVKDADIIDYNRAFSDAVADVVLNYAAVIKSATSGEKVVAAYYGKFFSIAGYIDWGELSIERMIASPDVDYLIAVEYAQRGAGMPHSVSAPLASYALHGKIFIDEADIRTFLSGSKTWAYAGTFFETISMIRKMFIYNWSKGHGIHWYDLHGGIFEHDGIQQAIANVYQVAAKTAGRRFKPAEVAVIVDEPAFLYTTAEIKKLSSRALLHLQNGNFGRMGTDFDVYFMNDIRRGDFPEYKMYVFMNAWAPDADTVKAIEKLKRDGKLLVWLYNAGLISDGSMSVANVSRLTGIQMKDAGKISLSMCLDPAAAPEWFRRINGPQYSSATDAAPAAYPSDPDAKCFGRFMKTPDIAPMALKKFGDWTSFYSTVPVLTPATWRELARGAGAHIYTEDPDVMLYIGDGLLGVHTGTDGVKTIEWPEPADFTDAVTGKSYGRNIKQLRLPMIKNETKIILIGRK